MWIIVSQCLSSSHVNLQETLTTSTSNMQTRKPTDNTDIKYRCYCWTTLHYVIGEYHHMNVWKGYKVIESCVHHKKLQQLILKKIVKFERQIANQINPYQHFLALVPLPVTASFPWNPVYRLISPPVSDPWRHRASPRPCGICKATEAEQLRYTLLFVFSYNKSQLWQLK